MAKRTAARTAATSEFDVAEDEPSPGLDATRLEELVAQMVQHDKTWLRNSAPIKLGNGVVWQPHATDRNGKKVAHFHFSEVLRPYLVKRFEAAHRRGIEVHLFVPLEAMYDDDVLRVLAEVDAHIHVYGSHGWTAGAHHLDALSAHRIPISPAMRTVIARATWARRRKGTSNEKGRRLESLLAFLFELVNDFRVTERNFRGDTDEIDLVLQVDQWSRRCWQFPGVPFVLVEAKNRKEKTDQPAVSLLIRRLQTKRGSTRIGMLLTTSGFTRDAEIEVAKTSEGNLIVVLMPPSQIEEWLDTANPDDFLEAAVRKAMLR